jgi:hypothetical protein
MKHCCEQGAHNGTVSPLAAMQTTSAEDGLPAHQTWDGIASHQPRATATWPRLFFRLHALLLARLGFALAAQHALGVIAAVDVCAVPNICAHCFDDRSCRGCQRDARMTRSPPLLLLLLLVGRRRRNRRFERRSGRGGRGGSV